MGGLYRFETRQGASAPELIEAIVSLSAQAPDAALPPDMMLALARLLASCMGGARHHDRQAMFLILRRPVEISQALGAFLRDPLGHEGGAEKAEGEGRAPLASVLDMRAAWLSRGAAPEVFDRLTLWEHGRVQREIRRKERNALAEVALAARMARADQASFRKFVRNVTRENRPSKPGAWVHAFLASAGGLHTITKAELAEMKGNKNA